MGPNIFGDFECSMTETVWHNVVGFADQCYA